MIIEQGSRWAGTNGKIFVVLSVVIIDDKTWVHYRDASTDKPPSEYSCYQESFLSRFYPVPPESNRNR